MSKRREEEDRQAMIKPKSIEEELEAITQITDLLKNLPDLEAITKERRSVELD